jgi:AraC family L-rhamnose operon transcriptional activator RhaR
VNDSTRHRLLGRFAFPAPDRPLLVELTSLTGDFNPHDHDFVETALITGGTGFHSTRQADIPLQSGDLILLAPGQWHAYRVPERLDVFNCCFGLSLLSRELTAVYSNTALSHLFSTGPTSLESRGAIVTHLEPAAFRRCLRYLRRMAAVATSDTAAQCYVEQMGFLLLYLAEVGQTLPATEALESHGSGHTHPAVIQCRNLLTEKYAHPWTLAELADAVHIAPKYLVRLFRESTGAAPMAYLARLRAERASLFLVDSDLSIAEIGHRVGWPDPNYFARRFRSLFGMTATEYRARFARHHSATGESHRE